MNADQNNTTRAWRDGTTALTRLLGPVNHETVPQLQREVERVLERPCQRLVLDLGASDYVDSDGVRWLQGLQTNLSDRGVEMLLAVRQGSKVDRTLALLRMDHAFSIERYPHDTPAGAAEQCA